MVNKKLKKRLIILGVIFVILSGLVICYLINNKEEEKNKIEVEVVDEISNYGYSISSLDSEYYKSLFEELKNVLGEEEVNKEEYAKLVAKLFVTDLYSIETKVNKYDVGGDIYFHADKRDMHKRKVSSEFYNLVKDNSYGDRKQDLPLVKEIEVVDYKTGKYTMNEAEVSSYVVTLKWDYVKDLGYDKEGKVILVDNKNKIEVVEFSNKVEE